jgi:hypothetical protein
MRNLDVKVGGPFDPEKSPTFQELHTMYGGTMAELQKVLNQPSPFELLLQRNNIRKLRTRVLADRR